MPESAQHLILGIVIYQVVVFICQQVFKRLTNNDFVTKKACEACSKQDFESMKRLTSEVAIIKGVLLVLAVKKEITPEELAKLTQYTG